MKIMLLEYNADMDQNEQIKQIMQRISVSAQNRILTISFFHIYQYC